MFGTLKPRLCQLGGQERTMYRRAYCGTCKALGDGYGQLSRTLLSYDIVFLAHVIEALADAPAGHESCRCPLMPISRRPTLAADSVPMKVAAAVQVVLAEQWLDDQRRDGQLRWRPLQRLARPKADRAAQLLEDLGLSIEASRQVSQRQAALEVPGQKLEALWRPTAMLLEDLFVQLGALPSIEVDSKASESLAALGHALGVAIYTLDALEDLEQDLRAGQFNPCLDAASQLSRDRYDATRTALESSLATISDLVARIGWRRNREVLESVVVGLRQRAGAAIRKTGATLDELLVSPPRPRPWPISIVVAAVAIWARLWSWGRRRLRRRDHAHAPKLAEVRSSACEVPRYALAMASVGGGSGGDLPPVTVAEPQKTRPSEESGGGSSSACCCPCDECCDCDCTSCECMRGEACSCDCCGDCDCCGGSCDCDCCNCCD